MSTPDLPPPHDPNPYQSNPYQAPQTLDPQPVDLSDRPIDQHILEQFHEQIRALGAIWLITGFVVGVLAVVIWNTPNAESLFGFSLFLGFVRPDTLVVAALFLGIGVVFCVLGVAVWRRQIWAIHAVTAFGTLVLFLTFVVQLPLGCCGALPMMLVAMQGYRVAKWAKRLEAAGIPLTS